MIVLPIPRRLNCYGNPVVNWDHWSVRLRTWLYEPLYTVLPFRFWLWLDNHNLIIYGDAEDCWVGGWELGEDD